MNQFPDMMKIPMKAVSKARPRVTHKGTYMDLEYVEAKAEFATHLAALRIPRKDYDGPVACEIVFGANEFWMQLVPIRATKPKGLRRNDIDNLVGFVLDASQDAHLIKNDSQVMSLDINYKQEDD